MIDVFQECEIRVVYLTLLCMAYSDYNPCPLLTQQI